MRAVQALEAVAEVGAERAERADALGVVDPEPARHRCLHRPRREVAHGAVLVDRDAVDQVDSVGERLEQPGNLLGRVLEVVVHRDDGGEPRRTHAGEDRIVLAVVSGQPKPPNRRVLVRDGANDVPGVVGTSVDHEQNFVRGRVLLQHRRQALDEGGK